MRKLGVALPPPIFLPPYFSQTLTIPAIVTPYRYPLNTHLLLHYTHHQMSIVWSCQFANSGPCLISIFMRWSSASDSSDLENLKLSETSGQYAAVRNKPKLHLCPIHCMLYLCCPIHLFLQDILGVWPALVLSVGLFRWIADIDCGASKPGETPEGVGCWEYKSLLC